MEGSKKTTSKNKRASISSSSVKKISEIEGGGSKSSKEVCFSGKSSGQGDLLSSIKDLFKQESLESLRILKEENQSNNDIMLSKINDTMLSFQSSSFQPSTGLEECGVGEDHYPPPSGSVSRKFTSVPGGTFNQAMSNHGSRITVLDGGSLANADSQAMFDHGSRSNPTVLDGSSLASLRENAQPSSQPVSKGADPGVNY